MCVDPDVASVFHLGRKGRDYFYAMEFVEGETLDHLIEALGTAGSETRLGGYQTSCFRFISGAQKEPRSPGHQAEQYNGKL